MWTLWFVPMLGLGICILVAAIVLRVSGARVASNFAFGCIVAPVLVVTTLAVIGTFSHRTDASLFKEIFGYDTTITEDRMLADNFGSGSSREIFLRLEPTPSERLKLFSTTGLKLVGADDQEFDQLASPHGFFWWLSRDPQLDDYCKTTRARKAYHFRSWGTVWIVECLDGGIKFPASENKRMIYVIALDNGIS